MASTKTAVPLSAFPLVATATMAEAGGVEEYKNFYEVARFPEGIIPPSAGDLVIRAPDFAGKAGFAALCKRVYDGAQDKGALSTLNFQINVMQGDVGWYLTRDRQLRLLRPGRHLRLPGALYSDLHVVTLNQAEVHLPPAPNVASFHVVQVLPGEYVLAVQGNVYMFLTAGEDREVNNAPCVGYHLFVGDRTFRTVQRVSIAKPVIQHGPGYIINVPPGFFCKALVGVKNVLLGVGQHRINVAGFAVPNPDSALVAMNDLVISHGFINIIRVPVGQMYRCFVQNRPYMLEHRDMPYVFVDPTFRPAASAFVNMSDKYIEHNNLHMVRLDLGELALVWLDNMPYVLGASALLGTAVAIDQYHIDVATEGEPKFRMYKFATPNFRFVRNPDGSPMFINWATANAVVHGPVHIIRVKRGDLCRVWNGSDPLILQPREEPYVFNSSSFRMASEAADRYPAFISRSSNVIQHGTHNYITVPAGMLCLVWHEGNAKILGAETLALSSETNMAALSAVATTADATIAQEGESHEATPAGVAVKHTFVIESSNFRLATVGQDGYDAWVKQSDKVIQHGPNCIITVEDGEVAIVRSQGKREAYTTGRYLLVSPTQVFERHMYLGVRTTMPEQLVTYDSQRIPIMVKFTVTYEIVNAQAAARYQGDGGLDHFLKQACHSTLRSCVNQTHILDMGRSAALSILADESKTATPPSSFNTGNDVNVHPTETTAHESKDEHEHAAQAAIAAANGKNGFADQFHAAFEHQTKSLTERLGRVGVILIDLSIQDWSIEDQQVVDQLEALAMQTVGAQVSSAKFAAEARTAQLSAQGSALASIARARGEASVKQAGIDAENQAMIRNAEAKLEAARLEAAAMQVRATAEANATISKAEAEAKAIEMRGEAEAAAKEKLLKAMSNTPPEEWTRLIQSACTGVLQGANVTVTPDGLSSVMSMMAAGSPLFANMRALTPAAPSH